MTKLLQESLIHFSLILHLTIQAKVLQKQYQILIHIQCVTVVVTQVAMAAEVGDKQWNIIKVM